MTEAIVRKCSCKHSDQDKIYGEGQRLCNQTSRSKDQHVESRCTVCGSLAVTTKK